MESAEGDEPSPAEAALLRDELALLFEQIEANGDPTLHLVATMRLEGGVERRNRRAARLHDSDGAAEAPSRGASVASADELDRLDRQLSDLPLEMVVRFDQLADEFESAVRRRRTRSC